MSPNADISAEDSSVKPEGVMCLMHAHYEDILSRIAQPPLWFDEVGVPRFSEFAPTRIWNIYAREALLLEIQCQSCGHPFQVAMSYPIGLNAGSLTLAESIRQFQTLHYGDPPNIQCCDVGPTMSSVARRVAQFWDRGEIGWKAATSHLGPTNTTVEKWRAAYEAVGEVTAAGWDRVPELEIPVKPRWEVVDQSP